MDDQESFTWFFTAEYPQVVRLLSVVMQDPNAAEDVAQDAFVRLHRHWERVSNYERPETWIRHVALNCARSWRRREGRRLDRERRAAWREEPGETGMTAETMDVLRAVGMLHQRDRALIALYYLEDRPLAEVAELLQITENAAKVAVHRARRRLAEELGEWRGVGT